MRVVNLKKKTSNIPRIDIPIILSNGEQVGSKWLKTFSITLNK